MDNIFDLEPLFWISLFVGLFGVFYGWNLRKSGVGYPIMISCITVIAWYHGDLLYNGYNATFRSVFQDQTISNAWLQVSVFFAAFLLFATIFNSVFNAQFIPTRTSTAYRLITEQRMLHSVQTQLKQVWPLLVATWVLIKGLGLWRLDFDILGYFFPYIAGYRLTPWFRGRLGGGLDFLIVVVNYLDYFCLGTLGVVAALTYSTQARWIAILMMFLSWPEVLFDRTRNLMIAVVLPGILSFVFIRLRGRMIIQIATLAICFMGIDFWFRFVMSNRDTGSIASAFASGKISSDSRHEGFNMFEELCWINKLTESGEYNPNFGMRYFSELVNPIPRIIWPDKPMIGIDWALARGQGGNTADDSGVFATISTGLIGQGSVNFGIWVGPVSSAVLLAIWCTILARFDLTPEKPGRMFMFIIGCVLTFNLGRDITLLIMYPVGFAYILFSLPLGKWFNKQKPGGIAESY